MELFPLLVVVSLLPFLSGGESELSKLIFFIFPIFYLPIFFLRKRKVSKSFFPVIGAWAVFVLVNLVSTISSISLNYSLPVFIEVLGIFSYFVFFYFAVSDESHLKLLAFWVVSVGFILSLMSIYYIFSRPLTISTMNLVYAVHGHNHLADYLVFVLPIILVSFIKAKKGVHTILLGSLLTYFYLSFLLTFSRSGYVAASLMTIFIIWFYKPGLKKAFVLYFGTLLPILTIALMLLISHTNLADKIESPKGFTKNWIERQVVKPINKESRPYYWQQAIAGFKLRPLFGNGPETFRLTSKRFQTREKIISWFAHNSILQYSSEIGLVGVLSFLTVLAVSTKTALRNIKRSGFTIPLMVGVFGSLLQSLLSFNLNFLAINLLLWILIASALKVSLIRSRKYYLPSIHYLLIVTVFISFVFAFSSIVSGFIRLKAKQIESSSQVKAYSFYRRSILLPSLDTSRFYDFLRFAETKRQIVDDEPLADKIVLWNREDPDIHHPLGNYFYEEGIFNKSFYHYHKLLSINYLNSTLVYDAVIKNYPGLSNEYSLLILYDYLLYASKHYTDNQLCIPFCLTYDTAQNALLIFKNMESDNRLKLLKPSERAKMYFWLSTFNIWHEDDETTLNWLQNAVNLDPANKEYFKFYDELEKIRHIKEDLSINKYFMERLDDAGQFLYQKIYLAKASAKLADYFLEIGSNKEALFYLQKSLRLNPWNQEYYKRLYELHKLMGDASQANQVLEQCNLTFPETPDNCAGK